MVFLRPFKRAIILTLAVVIICLGDNEIEDNLGEIDDNKNNEFGLEDENNSNVINNIDIKEQELIADCDGSRDSSQATAYKKLHNDLIDPANSAEKETKIIKFKLPKLMEYWKSLRTQTIMQMLPNEKENFTDKTVRIVLDKKKYIYLEEAIKTPEVILLFEPESKRPYNLHALKCPKSHFIPLKKKPYLTVPKPPKFKRYKNKHNNINNIRQNRTTLL